MEAVEINPPKGQQPIHWRLLTTHTVVCIEQALQVIEWYKWRWRIEQLFATLKSVGLDLEATQLESIKSIQKLCVLALSVAVRILQLIVGRDQPELPATYAFNDEQQQCLSQIAPTVSGQTLAQQNPDPPHSLPWAVRAQKQYAPTDYCSTGWLVWLSVSKTAGNYYLSARTRANFNPFFMVGNSL